MKQQGWIEVGRCTRCNGVLKISFTNPRYKAYLIVVKPNRGTYNLKHRGVVVERSVASYLKNSLKAKGIYDKALEKK